MEPVAKGPELIADIIAKFAIRGHFVSQVQQGTLILGLLGSAKSLKDAS